MLKNEYYMTREDGVELFRSFSDTGMMIRKDGTQELYSEAIDVSGTANTFTETDIPVEDESEPTVEDLLVMLGELGVNTNDDED